MNEPDFERSLGEWMRTGRTSASAWVLESVIEHAHQQPNRSWWARLQQAWSGRRQHLRPPGGATAIGLTAVAATATAVLVAVPIVMTAPSQHPDEAPAFAPASPDYAPRPRRPPSPRSASRTERSRAASGWSRPRGRSTTTSRSIPTAPSWSASEDLGSPVGIGLWRPDGQGGISSVIVYPDADPERHQARGVSTYQADWTLDEAAESGMLAWTAELQSIDGTSLPDASGHSRLTRLHRLGLPPEAIYDLPAEPAWKPIAGSHGPGCRLGQRGRALAHRRRLRAPRPARLHGGARRRHEPSSRAPKGSGAGLWIPSGPDTRALTGWAPLPDMQSAEGWVGQLKQRALVVGTTEAFDGLLPAAPRRLVGHRWRTAAPGRRRPLARRGHGLAGVDRVRARPSPPISRTARSSPATRAYGVGAGYWQPLDDDTIASWVSFPSAPGSDKQMRSEATIAPDGESMSMTSILKDNGHRLGGGAHRHREATAPRALTSADLTPGTAARLQSRTVQVLLRHSERGYPCANHASTLTAAAILAIVGHRAPGGPHGV